MYAVVKTGGKQYRVEEGVKIQVEKIPGDEGSTVELGEVLLVADDSGVRVGKPLVDGVKVVARITAHDRGKKLVVFKMRRRKGFRKKNGHRQPYTALEILGLANQSQGS
ncbi:MAG: 50S ribosomal protein L21 [Pseudomonadota bacterium]